ncbi:hypothetical protein [Agaribacter flavus]|uniref:Tripartite tricarboxylate transporter TctB family protein n=1 Tax=Agaribacter flavus TaxID=1902781 RepID=A0ABV7FW97_9ALTE
MKYKSTSDPEQFKQRQYDFKFVVVLFVVLLILVKLTLSFPMTGSYGGVENQWYVSPALFPLILLTALFLCCIALLTNALKYHGYQHFFEPSTWFGNRLEAGVIDRWLIICLLISYVYILIPSADFYLATCVFVLTLTSTFYLKLHSSRIVVSGINLLLTLALIVTKLVTSEQTDLSLFDINTDETLIRYCDTSTAIALLVLVVWQCVNYKKTGSKLLVFSLIAGLIVPLLLVIAFSFLLYVPMPVEYGSVSSFLSWLVYEKLAW